MKTKQNPPPMNAPFDTLRCSGSVASMSITDLQTQKQKTLYNVNTIAYLLPELVEGGSSIKKKQ
ncbi:MAG: hypothetical protein Q8N05_04840 [Bacteroidota bacterium]|nr:hypothetical protein [Bacteroidota bacterium]